MPRAKRKAKPSKTQEQKSGAAVRAFWSGTITFGLVSIPVDLLSAVRARQTAMKLIDKQGHALGREYRCSKDNKKLANDELVRGYETSDGKMVTISDEEFAAAAPEMSSDINLRNFVPLNQIPPLYFQKPYFLAPAGKSARSYNLLAATMARTGHAGIGSFVMRGHEYLVAIVSDNGMLRADTLRYADEIRSPESIGLPKKTKAATKLVNQFIKEIENLKRSDLDTSELKDSEAEELAALVKAKKKNDHSVIHQSGLESDDAESSEGSAKIIDLMAVLRRSLSGRAVVKNAAASAPISLDERRALKHGSAKKTPARKKAKTRSAKSRRRRSGE